ncbi:glycosyltransferase family 4 protein [Micromonospora zamorensis]|uniref:glycosyltransferase family 4 protein n=2 Tax=Micromonospora zamorensis TaxID=709883 RepID=UPI002E19E279
MRVLHICDDLPLPAVHGGRVAMRNEVAAMRAAGHEVFVLGFHHEEDLTPGTRSANEDFVNAFVPVPRRTLVRATLSNPLLPYQVSSRLEDDSSLAEVRSWKPDLIVSHHEWTLPVAFRLREELGPLPVVLRAHNDEVRYFRDLLRAAKGVRAPYLLAEYVRIRKFFRAVRDFPITKIWFMSPDDVAPRFGGIPHTIIPPIMFDVPISDGLDLNVHRARTVTFIGSLDIPHAIEGLQWFLAETWPKVLARVPDATLTIAGRRPVAELIRSAAATPNVTLVVSPEDINQFLAVSRVFVNPVFAGSGVNLKLGDPMRWAIPVVTTTVGGRGLSALSGALSFADTPEAFAERIATLLSDDRAWREAKDSLVARRDAYSAASVGALLNAAVAEHAVRPSVAGA